MSTEAQALLAHITALLREGRRVDARVEEGPQVSRVEVWIDHGDTDRDTLAERLPAA